MNNKALLLVFLIYPFAVQSQNGINQVGAKPAGLGYAVAATSDKWGLFNNPGGVGNIGETSAMVSFENKFGITGLNSLAAGFINKFSVGSAGLSVYRFGDDLYNEQIASLTYANTFGIASLGIRANYLQYSIEGLGTKGLITIDLGGTASLTELITVGAYIRNINQGQISEINDQRAPTILYAGLNFLPTKKLLVAIETEKDVDEEGLFKAGIQYEFLEKFSARTGVRTNRFTNFFGLSFITQNLTIDYALTLDNVLGTNHQASLSYSFQK